MFSHEKLLIVYLSGAIQRSTEAPTTLATPETRPETVPQVRTLPPLVTSHVPGITIDNPNPVVDIQADIDPTLNVTSKRVCLFCTSFVISPLSFSNDLETRHVFI